MDEKEKIKDEFVEALFLPGDIPDEMLKENKVSVDESFSDALNIVR